MKFSAYLWWLFLNLALVKGTSLLSNVTLAEDSFWEHFQAYTNTKYLNQEWITSEAVNNEGSKIYGAQWRLSQGRLQGSAWDKGIAVRTGNAAAMIGHLLETPINVSETDTLVVQYEIKLDNSLTCGGAFIKLMSGFMNVEALKHYAPDTEGVELVFGPDYCAPEINGVQFAINKVDKITHESKLRYLQEMPLSKLTDTSQSHLYTLIIDESAQSFQILIDGKTVMVREHIEDKKKVNFEPPITPPLMIPDVSVAKPHDWDDRIRIPDPEAVKLSDRDERDPLMIPHPDGTEPPEWNSSISEYILDPNAQKPSWWKELEHGEWIPPMIKNPLCTAERGCGQQIAGLIKNSKYKGPGELNEIINPNYMGEWHPPEIENPLYYEEQHPLRIENVISGVILEFWSGSPNMLITNIYVGKNVTEAEIIGNKTWLMRDRTFRGSDGPTERKFMNSRLGNLQTTFHNERESPNPFDRIIDRILEQPLKFVLTAAVVLLTTSVLCCVVFT